MKKILFLIIIINITFSILVAQSSTLSYPTATKYATILYATEAKKNEGTFKNYAAHFVVSGTGEFNWQQEFTKGGEYEVVLSYSVRKQGASVTVSSEKNKITDPINITGSVYNDSKEWYQFNCVRKLLKGKLNLSTGLNSIRLTVNAPGKDFETIIYSIELIPIEKKSAIIKEITQARKARPQMDWFSALKYGLMFHWTSLTTPRSGPLKTYNEAVNDFDVDSFVQMVEKTGADYVIFTGCWAETYIPAPLQKWEKEYPGHTTKRDLISEISNALKRKNIKFILYLSTHVYAKLKSADTKEFERLNYELVSEIGEQFKNKIDGYWFDGWYQSYLKHPGFDFEKFYRICKKGNPERLLALNAWLYPIVTEWQDYWAGEIYTPGTFPEARIIKSGPGKGQQFHALLAIEADWAHTALNTKIIPNRLGTDDLISYISSCTGKGPVTINIEIYQDGTISEEALTAMEKIKQAIKK